MVEKDRLPWRSLIAKGVFNIRLSEELRDKLAGTGELAGNGKEETREWARESVED